MRWLRAKWAEKLGKPGAFCNKCVGVEAEKARAIPAPGTVILLENLRFNVEGGEGTIKAKQDAVGKLRMSLKALAGVCCNDAFGTAHRDHRSMVGEACEVKCSGGLMSKERDALAKALCSPAKPVLAIPRRCEGQLQDLAEHEHV